MLNTLPRNEQTICLCLKSLVVRESKTFYILVKNVRLQFNNNHKRGVCYMAITKDKKQALVAELTDLFGNARAVATAAYAGLSVPEQQELRKQAREAGVTIKVVKNRLVRVALSQSDTFKDSDTSLLEGQLLYAFSQEDEVAPAQVLATFAKKHPQLSLTSGYDSTGAALDTAAIQSLASLPSKDQLRGMVVSTIAAPLTGFLGVANGAQRGFAQVLSQRAEELA